MLTKSCGPTLHAIGFSTNIEEVSSRLSVHGVCES